MTVFTEALCNSQKSFYRPNN